MKIAVSTIAKNEADNVKDFVESCQEADLVSVLDTGSTDGTQELLKKYNVFAGEKKIEPWDFGRARNEALNRLPEDVDVVVSIDLDERLQPGWRKALEEVWQPDTEALSYRYVIEWQDKKQTIPAVIAWRSKVFKRKGFKWFNPVHEIPLPEEKRDPNLFLCQGMVVHHFQKGIRDYTALLTEWLKKDPEYQDGYIQRGSDYIKMEKYREGIDDFEKYLEFTRNEQRKCGNPNCQKCRLVGGRRAYSHLDIARAKHKLGFAPYEIIKHFLKAVAEAPDLREAWTYLADGFYSVGNYPAAYGAAMNALQITNPGIYPQEMICWADYPKNIADNAFSKLITGTNQFKPRTYRIGQSLSDDELGQYLKKLIDEAVEVPGNFIECGVCHGYSFSQIALAFYQSGQNRILYGLDSWDKMQTDKEDYSLSRLTNISDELANFEQDQGTPEEVAERLKELGIPQEWIKKHIQLIKGNLADTLPSLKTEFAFAHLDVDIYKSYKIAMENLWPKISKNGIVALDEYGDAWWPGAQKAIDEYLEDKKGQFQFRQNNVGQTVRWSIKKIK